MKLIKGTGFYFGIPEPPITIRGFEIIAREDEFLSARQGDKTFAVVKQKDRIQLLPWSTLPNGKRCVRTDRAINLPLEMANL